MKPFFIEIQNLPKKVFSVSFTKIERVCVTLLRLKDEVETKMKWKKSKSNVLFISIDVLAQSQTVRVCIGNFDLRVQFIL